MKFMDLKREQTDVSWRSAHDSSNVIFTYGTTDRGLIDLLGANVTHATLLAVPTADVESVVELLRPYAALPAGYRLATADDKRDNKPDGTLYWSRWRWLDASSREWNPENVYAVPRSTAHAQLRAEIERLEAELEASKTRLDELKGALS
jgi:hypothetical protein